jgi:regulatory protein
MAWACFSIDSRRFTMAKTEPSLRARAMRFLARREHSRAELQRKLSAIAPEGENVEALLDDLAQRGWLSDARFAEQSVRARARRFGPLKVASDLRGKGVAEDAIGAAFRAVGADGTANLEAIWRSRFDTAPANDRERARQVRFLQGRGFALDPILKFLREVP